MMGLSIPNVCTWKSHPPINICYSSIKPLPCIAITNVIIIPPCKHVPRVAQIIQRAFFQSMSEFIHTGLRPWCTPFLLMIYQNLIEITQTQPKSSPCCIENARGVGVLDRQPESASWPLIILVIMTSTICGI
jgi:hypothetical protein